MTKVYDTATDLITFSRLQAQNTTSGSSYLGSDGLLKFAAEDEPRIEYGSDGSLKGLLIEEQRTNLVTYSEDFSQWSSTALEPLQTGFTSPDGASNGTKIIPTTASTAHYVSSGGVTVTNGATYTFSFFAKKPDTNGYRYANTWASAWADKTGQGPIFDLQTGLVENENGLECNMEDYGQGWYRCVVTGSVNNTSLDLRIYPANASTALPYAGDGTSGIYIWGAQLEEGSFATSYIPTSGSQSTRSPDIASIPVSAFGYNQDAGTVVVEFDTVGGADISDDHYVLSGGNTNSRWAYHNTEDILKIYDGSAAPVIMSNQDDLPVKHKFAVASDASSVSTASGGSITEANVTSTGNLPALTTAFVLGSSHAYAYQLNGHIKSIQYYPRRLTDAQLQTLTS